MPFSCVYSESITILTLLIFLKTFRKMHENIRNQIIIIDFGSQYTQLIARRIRSLHFYCEIISCLKFKLENYDLKHIGAFILSGGPNSIYVQNAPQIDKKIFEINKPILGICYGLQLIASTLGGIVESGVVREFGKTRIQKVNETLLTKDWFEEDGSNVTWMSHEDCVKLLPEGFSMLSQSENGNLAIMGDENRKIYGIQFHPEVNHTNNGNKILLNFIKLISCIDENWEVKQLIQTKINEIEKLVPKDAQVIAAVSGGVDSTVASILTQHAIKERLTCIFVDNGLLRKNESESVCETFKKHNINMKRIDARELFLSNLANVSDPETKRKIIGRLFIEIFEGEAKKFDNAQFLMQGTLYTDIIESYSPNNSTSATIKSHHNVGGLPEKMKLKLIEPLKDLFKDEVRELGKALNISEDFIKRHPFPGPGLAIRIDGDITEEKIRLAQEIDHIFIQSIKEFGIYDEIWQAFVFLTDLRSVGVMGDRRTYDRACVLRAIISSDGMTAKVYPMTHEHLEIISSRIVNQVRGINRVLYDCTSKPPGTIEFQ